MANVNELIKFAAEQNSNVIPFKEWTEASTQTTGFVSGIAKSAEINRVLAQGALAGYCMGQMIVDILNKDAKIESGTFFEDFKKALAMFVPNNIADSSLVFSKIDKGALATIDEAKAAVTNEKILTPLMAKHEILALMDLILPVGSFVMMDAEPDENFYCIATGGAYSRTKYPRLFKKWGTKYGTGDGSTTFNVANAAERVLQGAQSLSEVGKYLEASLPNIRGLSMNFCLTSPNYGISSQGAFYNDGTVGGKSIYATSTADSGQQHIDSFQFEASKSSATYLGTKLQPSALQLLACIRC